MNWFFGSAGGLGAAQGGYGIDEVRSLVVRIGLLALVLSGLLAAPAWAGENPFVPQDTEHPTANDG